MTHAPQRDNGFFQTTQNLRRHRRFRRELRALQARRNARAHFRQPPERPVLRAPALDVRVIDRLALDGEDIAYITSSTSFVRAQRSF